MTYPTLAGPRAIRPQRIAKLRKLFPPTSKPKAHTIIRAATNAPAQIVRKSMYWVLVCMGQAYRFLSTAQRSLSASVTEFGATDDRSPRSATTVTGRKIVAECHVPVSLAPWLQPGEFAGRHNLKPFKRFPVPLRIPSHRAKAAVLIRKAASWPSQHQNAPPILRRILSGLLTSAPVAHRSAMWL